MSSRVFSASARVASRNARVFSGCGASGLSLRMEASRRIQIKKSSESGCSRNVARRLRRCWLSVSLFSGFFRRAARIVVASSTAADEVAMRTAGVSEGWPYGSRSCRDGCGSMWARSLGMYANSIGPVSLSPKARAIRPRYHNDSSGDAGDRHGLSRSRRAAPISRSGPNMRIKSESGAWSPWRWM